MARIKLSGLVSSIDGSIGGMTFQKNAYGIGLSTKSFQSKSVTSLQQLRRLQLAAVSSAWRNLTNANRLSWSILANQNKAFAKRDKSKPLNAFNYFSRYHTLRVLSGDGTIVTTALLDQYPLEFVELAPLQVGIGQLQFVLVMRSISDDWYCNVSLSSPVAASKNFNHNAIRFVSSMVGTIAGGQLVYDTDIYSSYIQSFGEPPIVGNQLSCQLSFWHSVTGQFVVLPMMLLDTEPL